MINPQITVGAILRGSKLFVLQWYSQNHVFLDFFDETEFLNVFYTLFFGNKNLLNFDHFFDFFLPKLLGAPVGLI